MHLLVGYVISLMGPHPIAHQKIPSKENVRVSVIQLDEDPIAFDPNVKLGHDTTSTRPSAPLVHQGHSASSQAAEEIGSSDLDEVVSREEKDVLPLSELAKDVREIRDSIHSIEKDVDSSREDWSRISESIRSLKNDFDMFKIVLSGGDIAKLFSHTYKPGERNETSYSEFFRAYASSYLAFNSRYKDSGIWPIFLENRACRGVMSVDVEFSRDGLFRFKKTSMVPEFKDVGGKVESYYLSLFKKMPKGFVRPSECGLAAPFQYSYLVLNPSRLRLYNPDGTSLSSENIDNKNVQMR